ncbi:helix-hairpin-helix domain-containing protein [Orrella sp. JC864]|uniref:helix-hairpin-helix domain-containing protein n=1 Tax=Orrella sp. JC864 TaxID=3120298 RepID=UPI0012BD3433
MNPFLHCTVARPLALCRRLPWRPTKAGPAAGRAAAGSRLRRQAGCVALALGLAGSVPAWALDVNAASAEQLLALKGIGPKMAGLIVAERQRAGPYDSLEDLGERIRGLGPKRLQALQAAGLTVGGLPAAAHPAGTKRDSAAKR